MIRSTIVASALALVLAACGGSGDEEAGGGNQDNSDLPITVPTPLTTPVASPVASPTPAQSPTPTQSPSPPNVPLPEPQISPSPSPTPELVVAINAGGTTYSAEDNTLFIADEKFTGGRVYNTDKSIDNTDDDFLFQSERYGNFRYDIDVGPGIYSVALYFSEGFWDQRGERVFDIAIEGKMAVSGFDIVGATGGPDIAHVMTIPSVQVTDPSLTMEFITTVDNAKLSALKVMKIGEIGEEQKDSDNDGIADDVDRCPLIPGPAAELGCPPAVATPEPTPVITPSPAAEPAPSPSPIVVPSPAPSPEPSPVIVEPTPQPSPDVPPFDLALGKAWYESSELRCNVCHGNDGRSTSFPDLIGDRLLSNYDFDSLMLKVLFMSEQHGSSRCDGNEPGNCAYEVAAYIWVDFNNQELAQQEEDNGVGSACRIDKNSGMRRLTKTEMKHAIEDTFGVVIAAYDDLPKERNIGGFESIGAVQNSGSSFVLPLLDTSITAASAIFNSNNFSHNCSDNNLANCARSTLRPFAEKLTGLSDIDDLLDRLAELTVASAQSQGPGSSPVAPSGDQCDTTDECRAIFGNSADDCVDSRSEQSFCSCSGQRCDAINPIFDNVEHIDAAFEDALVALIMSPEFMYVRARESDQARSLSPQEVAKNLALTLWLSVPDDTLFAAANSGGLSTAEQISAQIDRMMDDEKFSRFKQVFFNQWLGFDNVQNYDVDDDELNIDNWDVIAADMTQESLLFMNHLLDNNLSVNDILTANYSFLNARLAAHYGIPGVSNNNFTLTTLPADSNRQGLLTQGAILTRGASGDHASVVIRGETILSGLSCDPPASPDDSIQEEVEELANANLSEYEKMQSRAEKVECAACHAVLDPVGWAFTGFDAAARPLLEDVGGIINDGVIDPSGIFKGDFYDGPLDMIQILSEQDRMEMCLSEKFMMYTLGRQVSYLTDAEDNCIIDEILNDVRATLPQGQNNIGMKDLIKSVLMHDVSRVQGDEL